MTPSQGTKSNSFALMAHVRADIERIADSTPVEAAHQETADAVQEILNTNSDSLEAALRQPYFGRLDYVMADGGERRVYLGVAFVRGQDVYSWTAPVGKLWYMRGYEGVYEAPRGAVHARVDLKRHLKIRGEELIELNDLFRRRLPSGEDARDRALGQSLSGAGTGDGYLQVIVATIEPEQYENIANVEDKALIVQGAAGSGKSEIGLHRIAYLLSPHNDIPRNERPTPETTLFVGPSRAFLEHAAHVLPELGVSEGVERVRFSDWHMDKLSARARIRSRVFNDLLNYGDMRRFHEGAETFKGGLAIADALDARVKELARELRAACRDLPQVSDPRSGATVGIGQLRAILDDLVPLGGAPQLNIARERFIDRITASMWAESERSRRSRGLDALRRRRALGRGLGRVPLRSTGKLHSGKLHSYSNEERSDSTGSLVARA